MNYLGVISLTLIIWLSPWVMCELFTSTSDLETLLETHKNIIGDLDLYIEKEEKRLAGLKNRLNVYTEEFDKAMDDKQDYLGNPINAFTLIKRLTTDLDHIEKTIQIGTEFKKNIDDPNIKYPTTEDLEGAAQALTRLQDTYHLDVRHLSEGVLDGDTISTPMTADDCFELGRALYVQGEYNKALAWLTEALRKYGVAGDDPYCTDAAIMDYISFSHYYQGDIESALEWTKKIVAVDPNNARAVGNVHSFEREIVEQRKNRTAQSQGDSIEATKTPPSVQDFDQAEYEALCRGERALAARVAAKLKCYYEYDNHAFLRLAPFKVEQMYEKPDILLYYQVLSDAEIQQIQAMAQPRMQRALVSNLATGEQYPGHLRISKSGWLRDDEASVVRTVSQRVADMTALDMTTAEELQVANYGIGGHFVPHYDMALSLPNAPVVYPGRRIATVLFYMSEVAQGGATVFTELGLSVFPVKNAAVFWMNLHPSGEGDLATRHAACPVLRGSKWVCNKWLHQGGQELVKPCNLEYQQEIPQKMPKSVPISVRKASLFV